MNGKKVYRKMGKSMNENRKFRNHISVVLEQTAGVLAAIAVLVVTQLLEHLDEILKADLSFLTEKGALIVPGVILLLAAAVIAQVLVWRKTYISIEDNAVVIEKGSVNKQKNTIGIRNISNINLEQNLIEMLFGTCKVKLDTQVHGGQHGCEDRAEEGGCALVPSGSGAADRGGGRPARSAQAGE